MEILCDPFSSVLVRKDDVVFFYDFSEVNERIAHSSQSRIDAHPRVFGDFLKAHILVDTHQQHFFLVIR